MTALLQRLGEQVGGWLYLIAGGLAFAEAAILVGLVLPGETALLVAGYYSQRGVLSLPLMIVVAVVCAIAGDSVGYEFGRWFGPRLRNSRIGRVVGDERWESADAFLQRHGGKAVLFGRAIAVLRALVPSMAGMSRMRYRTFLPWNALGGLLWGSACVLLGWAFAGALDTVQRYLTWGPIPIVVVLIAFVVFRAVRKRRRERAAEKTDDASPEQSTVQPTATDSGAGGG
ncbi:MAG: DedA family protein [Mycobacteriales bacterium]